MNTLQQDTVDQYRRKEQWIIAGTLDNGQILMSHTPLQYKAAANINIHAFDTMRYAIVAHDGSFNRISNTVGRELMYKVIVNR